MPRMKPVNPLTGETPVTFRWEDPRPSGEGSFEVTISGSAEGVDLPIVARTEMAAYMVELPSGTYTCNVTLLDDLGEVSHATPETEEVVIEPTPITAPRLVASPNPFHTTVNLAALLPTGSGPVQVEILDVSGGRVTVLNGDGGSVMVWDGRNTRGTTVPPGIYWARLRSTKGVAPVKLVRF